MIKNTGDEGNLENAINKVGVDKKIQLHRYVSQIVLQTWGFIEFITI